MALAPMDLVDADGLDTAQFSILQAPLDKPFDRAVDGLPTGPEHACGFAPRQAPRPSRQERHHRRRDRAFAIAPGKVLDHDPMFGALDPTGGIEEEHWDGPQRDEAPAPFGKAVIARTRLPTRRAFG